MINNCFFCKKFLWQKKVCNYCKIFIINPNYFFIGPMKVWSCCIYNDVTCQPILNLKYNKNPYVAKKIAQYIFDNLCINWNDYDYLVPIPTTYYKIFIRGYNPANLIAVYLSQLTNIPINYCLKKIDNSSQINKSQNERILGPKFLYNNSLKNNYKILIIDDVVTTGATLFEAYNQLKNYHQVEGLVFNSSKKFLNKLIINYQNNNFN